MRFVSDKESYIKEIQRFLTRIGGVNIKQTGVYDEVTKTAVRQFKSSNGLNEDTVVDYETYNLIYQQYLASQTTKKSLRRGDRGDDVLELNMMLSSVGAYYSEITPPPVSDYFSERTESGVRRMREVYMLDAGGEADEIFTEKLRYEYALMKSEEKNSTMR